MSQPSQPIQIPLTPEQQAMIRRLSGQHAEILEITPDAGEPSRGSGESLRFRWRLSTATGIPRQQWVGDDPETKTGG